MDMLITHFILAHRGYLEYRKRCCDDHRMNVIFYFALYLIGSMFELNTAKTSQVIVAINISNITVYKLRYRPT